MRDSARKVGVEVNIWAIMEVAMTAPGSAPTSEQPLMTSRRPARRVTNCP